MNSVVAAMRERVLDAMRRRGAVLLDAAQKAADDERAGTYLAAYKVPYIGSPDCGTKTGGALNPGAWWGETGNAVRGPRHFTDIA